MTAASVAVAVTFVAEATSVNAETVERESEDGEIEDSEAKAAAAVGVVAAKNPVDGVYLALCAMWPTSAGRIGATSQRTHA